MPYVDQRERDLVDDQITDLAKVLSGMHSGVQNYALTRLLLESENDAVPWSYAMLERVMGRLECIKAEVTRRVYVPKEDAAMVENGDISCLDPPLPHQSRDRRNAKPK